MQLFDFSKQEIKFHQRRAAARWRDAESAEKNDGIFYFILRILPPRDPAYPVVSHTEEDRICRIAGRQDAQDREKSSES